MKENILRTTISLALTGLLAYLYILVVPLIILVVFIILDYISGMVAAWVKKEISSRIGIKGIVKKLCYMLIVAVGMVVDWVVHKSLLMVNVKVSEEFIIFGLVVIIWLIINESISILENASEIGAPLPPFLISVIKRLKKTVEKKAEGKVENALGDKPKVEYL
jgi:toxin secretion/phage lysis holin